MIDKKLLLNNVPRYLGEQVHLNHKGCPAGEDKKRRLYIKKVESGVLAYCHHCGEKGYLSRTDLGDEISPKWDVRGLRFRAVTKPCPTLGPLSTPGKAWLSKYHVDWNENYFQGVVEDTQKVALAIMNPKGDIIGQQIRNLVINSIPKYVTYINDTTKGHTSWFHVTNSKTLVITEDYLSAYRVYRDVPGISSVALLKTNMSNLCLRQIAELEFNKILIWLDPDEAGTKGRKNILNSLSFFLPKVKILPMIVDREPKECSPDLLRSIVEGV